MPVLRNDPEVVCLRDQLPVKPAEVPVGHHINIARIDEVDKWPGDQFLSWIAGKLGSLGINEFYYAVLDDEDSLTSVLCKYAITFFGLPKRLFCLLAFGHVCDDSLDGGFTVVLNASGAHLQPAH